MATKVRLAVLPAKGGDDMVRKARKLALSAKTAYASTIHPKAPSREVTLR